MTRSRSFVSSATSSAVIVALLSLAVATVACGDGANGDPLHDLVSMPEYDECQDDCDDVLLEELTARVRSREPLTLFAHATVAVPAAVAEATLAEGWDVRGDLFAVQPPIDWAADPFDSRNWRFRFSAMYFLVPFLQLVDFPADDESAPAMAFAKEVFLDWDHFHRIDGKENDFRWYDHATGLRAAYLAFFLDRAIRAGALDTAELRALLFMASEHVVELSDPEKLAPNNHALFQLVGLAGLCRSLPELEKCAGSSAYTQAELVRIVTSQFGTDDIHTENSPAYHGYALDIIGKVLATGWLALPEETFDTLDRALANLPWLVRPDGLYAPIGDSGGSPTQNSLPVPEGHRVFPASGYAVLRTPSPEGELDSYLFLVSGEQTRSHNHWDALSFEWFDRDHPVLVDTGVYGTNDNDERDYAVSTRAHNTVEIDGQNSVRDTPSPPKRLESARLGTRFAILAEIDLPLFATTHRRIVILEPGQWLLVFDHLASDSPHEYTLWFHLGVAYQAALASSGNITAEDDAGRRLRMVHLADGGAIDIVRGQSTPRLQGWITGNYNQLVPNDAIGTSAEGQSATFVTLITLGASDSPVTIAPIDPQSSVLPLCWTSGDLTLGARVSTAGSLSLDDC